MEIQRSHVEKAFLFVRRNGIAPNIPSTKWDVVDPTTGERFPPKAVFRVAKELAGDTRKPRGGGPETNDPLRDLGFEVVLKPYLETSEVVSDIKDVLDSGIDETTKQRLVNARLGQGGFREAQFEIWEGKCVVTGCDVPEVLRASHIKAWRASSNAERLDPRNGLLLAASNDALFDCFLISCDENGSVLASSLLDRASLENLGLRCGQKIQLGKGSQDYMKWHRSEFDRRNGRNALAL